MSGCSPRDGAVPSNDKEARDFLSNSLRRLPDTRGVAHSHARERGSAAVWALIIVASVHDGLVHPLRAPGLLCSLRRPLN
jgi:hypothetical protein